MPLNIQILEDLLNTPSIPGFETQAAALFRSYLKEYADNVLIDTLGSTFAYKTSPETAPAIMLEAHIDEIGMQVLYIDDSGFIYVRRNGGIDLQCVPGSQVTIFTRDGKRVPGVIGKKPVHLQDNDARGKTIDLNKLWVDTGLAADVIKKTVSIGDPVVLNPNMLLLDNNRITSKALDDKIGVFAIAEAFRRLSKAKAPFSVCAAAIAQEEVGNRGASVGSFFIDPDYAICIDVDYATDVPDCPPQKYGNVKLGRGVVIQRNADSNQSFVQQALDIADRNNIPYQLSARPNSTGGTDTCKIQLNGAGVKTLGLGIPCRYMHTPVEMCDLRDVEAAIELMVAVGRELRP